MVIQQVMENVNRQRYEQSSIKRWSKFYTSHTFETQHNKPVSMNILAKICEYLECNVGDIVDYIPEDKEKEK